MSQSIIKDFKKYCEGLQIKPTIISLIVSIDQQKLYHYKNEELVRTYIISTSLNQPSCVENSFGTPNGLHEIAEKIGDNEPIGMIFKGRQPIDLIYTSIGNKEQTSNLITTRILWLRGLEENLNRGNQCDTYKRYIYIHGTNHESQIGTPFSKGCVLMRNQEMIEIFNEVPLGCHVWIKPVTK